MPLASVKICPDCGCVYHNAGAHAEACPGPAPGVQAPGQAADRIKRLDALVDCAAELRNVGDLFPDLMPETYDLALRLVKRGKEFT